MATQSGKPQDKFCQLAFLQVTESAATTLTFAKLEVATGALLGEKKFGMVVHRALYSFESTTLAGLVAAQDSYTGILSVSPNITTLDLANPEVIDQVKVERQDFGAAATGILVDYPLVHDFSGIGGLLVPADKLYLGIKGYSVAVAGILKCRLWYTMIELGVAEYWDLVESRRIIST